MPDMNRPDAEPHEGKPHPERELDPDKPFEPPKQEPYDGHRLQVLNHRPRYSQSGSQNDDRQNADDPPQPQGSELPREADFAVNDAQKPATEYQRSQHLCQYSREHRGEQQYRVPVPDDIDLLRGRT